jgi:putative membrane protein
MDQIIPNLGGINAVFNALSACCLLAGYVAVRSGRRDVHRTFMLSAFGASTLFLAGYLTRAALHGTRNFPGHGFWRTIYFAVLIPHMLLAFTVVPLVGYTLYYAFSGDFAKHRRIVRWTFPIWMYVSVTGVIVYLMLYHWPEA